MSPACLVFIRKEVSIFLEKIKMVRAHHKSRRLHIGTFSNPAIAGYGDDASGLGPLTIRALLQLDVTCDTKPCYWGGTIDGYSGRST